MPICTTELSFNVFHCFLLQGITITSTPAKPVLPVKVFSDDYASSVRPSPLLCTDVFSDQVPVSATPVEVLSTGAVSPVLSVDVVSDQVPVSATPAEVLSTGAVSPVLSVDVISDQVPVSATPVEVLSTSAVPLLLSVDPITPDFFLRTVDVNSLSLSIFSNEGSYEYVSDSGNCLVVQQPVCSPSVDSFVSVPITSTPVSVDATVGDTCGPVTSEAGCGISTTPTACPKKRARFPKPKRVTTPCSVIVTRAKGAAANQSFVKNKNATTKKCSKQGYQSSVQFVQIPSGSEDSELSDSGDDDCEIETHRKTQKRQHSVPSQRQIVSNTEPASGIKKHEWKQECIWSDGALHYDPDGSHSFAGTEALSESIAGLVTPLQFFRYFLTDDIIKLITQQTSLYSVQQCPNNPLIVTECDIECFIGIAVFMYLIKLASSRRYWSNRFRVSQIADVMSFNNFGRVKRFLHFSDNMDSTDDKLQKMRPLAEKVRDRFRTVPLEENLSVDEQIIPFKGRHGLKQYMPKKPHKWGYKVFVLSGVSGYAYDFEIYAGKQDNTMLQGEPDCGASGNVVIRLSRVVPSNCNFRIFFDNYFNSVDLQLALASRGILGLGTVRLNSQSVAEDCKVDDRCRVG